jgi:hypothetical protein
MCQTPGIWGSLPKGFTNLWEAPIEVYITYNVANYADFKFNKGSKIVSLCFFLLSFQYLFFLCRTCYSPTSGT